MIKTELRKIYLARQKELAPFERARRSFAISEAFFTILEAEKVRVLHSFLPIERFNEINTHLILEKIWRDLPRIETVVPRVDLDTNEIENLKFTHETELALNNWQINEPTHNDIIEAAKIDLAIVPLLCFDERGFRVGYGKGFYDRLMARCRPDTLKIGLSYFPPVKEISDVGVYDIKLDLCLTPEDIWRF
jgi:5-formyltetrahydrofolate cyclo-ligase